MGILNYLLKYLLIVIRSRALSATNYGSIHQMGIEPGYSRVAFRAADGQPSYAHYR